MKRMLPLIRILQLYGGDCPEIQQANDKMTKEMTALARVTLSRKHTVEELLCLYPAYLWGMLGDQATAFEEAFQKFVREGIARKEAADAAKAEKARSPRDSGSSPPPR